MSSEALLEKPLIEKPDIILDKTMNICQAKEIPSVYDNIETAGSALSMIKKLNSLQARDLGQCVLQS